MWRETKIAEANDDEVVLVKKNGSLDWRVTKRGCRSVRRWIAVFAKFVVFHAFLEELLLLVMPIFPYELCNICNNCPNYPDNNCII